jgi:hypothetical protein
VPQRDGSGAAKKRGAARRGERPARLVLVRVRARAGRSARAAKRKLRGAKASGAWRRPRPGAARGAENGGAGARGWRCFAGCGAKTLLRGARQAQLRSRGVPGSRCAADARGCEGFDLSAKKGSGYENGLVFVR